MIDLAMIKTRAERLAACRRFFQERGILEVDCCALNCAAPIDANIDVIAAQVTPTQIGFLHTSPEHAMKRLLAAGCGDIYYLGHVFRQSEIGSRHNPEFAMAEWYRIGISFEEMIRETCSFLSLFLGPLPHRLLSYRDAFSTYLDLDYTRAPISELLEKAALYNPSEEVRLWTRETLLHFLLTHAIEPKLGEKELTVLAFYPPEEAALARIAEKDGERVAERFEIYHQGVELANGYHELPDPIELRRRFIQANQERLAVDKPAYPLDEAFLSSLGPSFPDCCGVSVGLDRALMLLCQKTRISEVLPFSWAPAKS